MERHYLRALKDAVRSMDFVDERIFEETSALDTAFDDAWYESKPLDVDRVRRVREAIPEMLSALSAAMGAIDFALTQHDEESGK
ncbi:MAG TPA: hypothetical protein VIG24_01255 [Acidimicrobiia bacterium]